MSHVPSPATAAARGGWHALFAHTLAGEGMVSMPTHQPPRATPFLAALLCQGINERVGARVCDSLLAPEGGAKPRQGGSEACHSGSDVVSTTEHCCIRTSCDGWALCQSPVGGSREHNRSEWVTGSRWWSCLPSRPPPLRLCPVCSGLSLTMHAVPLYTYRMLHAHAAHGCSRHAVRCAAAGSSSPLHNPLLLLFVTCFFPDIHPPLVATALNESRGRSPAFDTRRVCLPRVHGATGRPIRMPACATDCALLAEVPAFAQTQVVLCVRLGDDTLGTVLWSPYITNQHELFGRVAAQSSPQWYNSPHVNAIHVHGFTLHIYDDAHLLVSHTACGTHTCSCSRCSTTLSAHCGTTATTSSCLNT